MSLRKAKNQLRKNIKESKEYFCDVVKEVITQKPQPNGKIYLHGEVITRLTVKDATRQLNHAISLYNVVDNL